MRPKTIILDFDGVILESVDIKTRAFRQLFNEFPEYLDEITEYHLKNGGLSRYKKFSYIYSKILKQSPPGKEQLDKMGELFSKIVFQEMISCPFVRGALEFIDEYSKKTELFIASGTPEEELRNIVDTRDISHYFKGIYGTPKTKPEILSLIITTNKIEKKDAVFIGDSINDYEAATIVGIPFIARIAEVDEANLKQYELTFVNDLVELSSLIKKIK